MDKAVCFVGSVEDGFKGRVGNTFQRPWTGCVRGSRKKDAKGFPQQTPRNFPLPDHCTGLRTHWTPQPANMNSSFPSYEKPALGLMFFFFWWGWATRVTTQGFILAKQALYHLGLKLFKLSSFFQ
jgi:hypothetical protein